MFKPIFFVLLLLSSGLLADKESSESVSRQHWVDDVGSVSEAVITRDLDPRYILNAITGATTAVAQLKEEKHPDQAHPISFLAALLQQTAKLVNYNMKKEEEKKEVYRAIPDIQYKEELQELTDFLVNEYAEKSVLKKLTKYTREFSQYLKEENHEAKVAFFDSMYQDKQRKNKFVGEILFVAGNYIADAAQKTAHIVTRDLSSVIQTKDHSLSDMYVPRSFSLLSLECQLIHKVSSLVDQTLITRERGENHISMVEQLAEIGGVLRNALSQDEEMLYYWQETSIVGPIIATEDFEERQLLIRDFITDQESAPLFVEQMVYCIYHVVFNKLGRMLKIAYEALQESEDLTSEDINGGLLDDDSDLDFFDGE